MIKITDLIYRTPALLRMYLIVAFAAVGISVAIISAYLLVYRMTIQHAGLVDATMEIKFEVAEARLWFEESLYKINRHQERLHEDAHAYDPGSPEEAVAHSHENIEEAHDLIIDYAQDDYEGSIKAALWYCNAILYGGENDEGLFIPIEVPELRQDVESVISMITQFGEYLKANHHLHEQAALDDIGHESGVLYNDIIIATDHVETELQIYISESIKHYRLLIILTLLFALGLLAIAAVVMTRFNTRVEISSQALVASEEKYRYLFEYMLSGFAFHEIEVDEDGKPSDYKFLEMNKKFSEVSGISSDIIDKSVSEVLGMKVGDDPDFITLYGNVALTGESMQMELYSPPLKKWFDISAYSPRKGYFATIFDDVTIRKTAELERERLLTELETKNKDLEQIVYISSHDLRAPLVNIQGFSDVLETSLKEISELLSKSELDEKERKMLASQVEESVPEALKFILASTSKMDGLLSGLLQFSRLGRAVLNPVNVDVNDMMEQIRRSFEYQVQERKVSVGIGTLPPCFGDENQLNQVFSNLFDNSLKYLDPSRPGKIEITGETEGNESIYCFTDNGIGIREDLQDKIFELFARLNPEDTDGDGLGLTNSRKIIERNRGRIWVESTVGTGSKIFVAVPHSPPI